MLGLKYLARESTKSKALKTIGSWYTFGVLVFNGLLIKCNKSHFGVQITCLSPSKAQLKGPAQSPGEEVRTPWRCAASN